MQRPDSLIDLLDREEIVLKSPVDAVIQMLRTAQLDGPVVLEVHSVEPIRSVRILKAAIEKP